MTKSKKQKKPTKAEEKVYKDLWAICHEFGCVYFVTDMSPETSGWLGLVGDYF